MAILFPATPTLNQVYIYGSREWIWNGEGWALNINAGQVSAAFRQLNPAVTSTTPLPADLSQTTWLHKVYL